MGVESSVGNVASGMGCDFLANFTRPRAPIQWANFLAQVVQVCLETRLSSESLEPLIGLLIYLETKLCPKN